MENTNEIICYCLNISAGEISEAVINGAKNHKEVYNYLKEKGKNFSEVHNPTGKCCTETFKAEIEKSIKQ